VLLSLACLVVRRLFELIVLYCRSPESKELEILVLRHELSILRRRARRPRLQEADRVFLAALSRMLPRRAWPAFSVSPRTLLRWHQRLVARRWRYPRIAGPAVLLSIATSRCSSSGSRGRTRLGATGGSSVSSAVSASAFQRVRSVRSSSGIGCHPRPNEIA
jgi:hypothetical protein